MKRLNKGAKNEKKKNGIIVIIICIGLIVGWIYALVVYGGKSITEIPFWALWLLGRK